MTIWVEVCFEILGVIRKWFFNRHFYFFEKAVNFSLIYTFGIHVTNKSTRAYLPTDFDIPFAWSSYKTHAAGYATAPTTRAAHKHIPPPLPFTLYVSI